MTTSIHAGSQRFASWPLVKVSLELVRTHEPCRDVLKGSILLLWISISGFESLGGSQISGTQTSLLMYSRLAMWKPVVSLGSRSALLTFLVIQRANTSLAYRILGDV
jgi:hypothetical protein